MSGIQIKNYHFKATLIPSVITAILLYTMISLGYWQLDRADYKANLQTLIESKQASPSIALSDIAKEEINWLYQPVYARGKFDQKHQILFDNQVHNMVAGYSVFTPLKLTDDSAILVNRGWLPLGGKRKELPDITIENDEIRINGLVAHAPSKILLLSKNVNSYQKWPAVLQYIDLQEIQKELNYSLLPMIIIMDQKEQTVLEPLPVKINMRSAKHTAYAFQWYGLSLTLFIIYIVVNTKKIKV